MLERYQKAINAPSLMREVTMEMMHWPFEALHNHQTLFSSPDPKNQREPAREREREKGRETMRENGGEEVHNLLIE